MSDQRDTTRSATRWKQFLLNLKVWAPFLANPQDRERMVRYASVDERIGLKWELTLPNECWYCRKTTDLQNREYRTTRWSFEHAIGIVGVTLAGLMIVLMLAVVVSWTTVLTLFCMVAVIGLAVLRLKGWKEEIHLVIRTCSEHADSLPEPELAVDDQSLIYFAPTWQFAEIAAQDYLDRRKNRGGRRSYSQGSSAVDPVRSTASPTMPERSSSSFEPPPIRPAVTKPQAPVDLPPIKLAGEEDDT